MPTDEERIRTLIERWAAAVHRGDLTAVLADHAEDIVMFDVPPPRQGVRGLDAYRETWPPFFQWQAQGASFEIESLDVIAGDEVAFAYALLRCGTPDEFAHDPDNRLRLTLGLRKQDGRWVVAHEHHSFPLTDSAAAEPGPGRGDDAAAEQDLRGLHQRWFDRTTAKDLDGLMAGIAEDVVSYEHDLPLQHLGVDQVREVCKAGLDAAGDGSVTWQVPDLTILVNGDLAVAWGLNQVRVTPPKGEAVESWSRGTRIFERRDGAWLMIHQHLSYPYDPTTGQARTDLHP
ncbi:SgcJ/EcaC family oxidoreductase [Micromonospora sp. DR5-3]|uniref:YybH family protein n=1 Tax=unclassified Micromonospora TaxID=2617518 RepID=UPI0011D860A0|nr:MULTISPECIES: SgcJ/EcaC family oxidoreductase [unclassified Micromonospora]MCW3816184.1 SgcJ/EcaC family oxidoreductase [Micromonospora sp. DR5-3]TYC19168.1 SgcJ/EcaC family oxidoreductase [Micromonospora sp. MP36]